MDKCLFLQGTRSTIAAGVVAVPEVSQRDKEFFGYRTLEHEATSASLPRQRVSLSRARVRASASSSSKPFWAPPKFLNTKELHVGGQMPLRLEILGTNS